VFIALVILFSLTSVAYAANDTGLPSCTDTDGGASGDDAYTKRGDVKYGLTTQTDICLTSESGVSTNSSKWLKEYYCTGSPLQRQSKVIDCTREGFLGCENGACKSSKTTSGSGSNITVTRPRAPVVTCGDERTDKTKGEECDPPNSICFGKTSKQYGQCQSNCKCKLAESAEKPVAVCGDDAKDEGEECEKDTDCVTNSVCSSCKCVKQLTPEEIEAMRGNKTPALITSEVGNTTPEPAPINLTVKNFTESAGIKATSGIAGFFKNVFSWIAAVFS